MLTDATQVAIATTVTTNVFLGRPIEFIAVPSVCTLLATYDTNLVASAANPTPVSAQWLINVGGVQLVPLAAGSTVNAARPAPGTAPAQIPAVGVGPIADEDTLVANQPIPAGARSQLNVTNGLTITINFRYRAFITP